MPLLAGEMWALLKYLSFWGVRQGVQPRKVVTGKEAGGRETVRNFKRIKAEKGGGGLGRSRGISTRKSSELWHGRWSESMTATQQGVRRVMCAEEVEQGKEVSVCSSWQSEEKVGVMTTGDFLLHLYFRQNCCVLG